MGDLVCVGSRRVGTAYHPIFSPTTNSSPSNSTAVAFFFRLHSQFSVAKRRCFAVGFCKNWSAAEGNQGEKDCPSWSVGALIIGHLEVGKDTVIAGLKCGQCPPYNYLSL
jgi:hypothetical protein